MWNEILNSNEKIKFDPIHGKNYAPVKERVIAFRRVFPLGAINTEIIECDSEHVIMKTTILIDGEIVSTGIAMEEKKLNKINNTSMFENCETSAVGRALGFIGFGISDGISSADELQNALIQQESIEKYNKLMVSNKKLIDKLRNHNIDVRKKENHNKIFKNLSITCDMATWTIEKIVELEILNSVLNFYVEKLEEKEEGKEQ